MEVPLKIIFEDFAPSEAVEAKVRENMDKLEHFFSHITSARVVISQPHKRQNKGNIYDVKIYLALPAGGDLIVDKAPGDVNAHEDLYVALRDSFNAARRQLQDYVDKLKRNVKTHEVPLHGVIASLEAEGDYGFIATSGGRELYFHRNSVKGDGFFDLVVGEEVRFAEDVRDEGPYATFVQPVGKHHIL